MSITMSSVVSVSSTGAVIEGVTTAPAPVSIDGAMMGVATEVTDGLTSSSNFSIAVASWTDSWGARL